MVLISFREWLHSYTAVDYAIEVINYIGSHLFQRVASFLPGSVYFDEWDKEDCSHLFQRVASFLRNDLVAPNTGAAISSHLFQRVASFLHKTVDIQPSGMIAVLISFREWLHSYSETSSVM